MGYIQGDGRNQATLFPVILDELVPADHVCRVIDAFVEMLVMSELGFERAQAAETGRPGYDPRDLLKLYLYGYLNQIRSSRRLEAECRRNVELMWLLGRLYPDYKSIAEFRRMHRDAMPGMLTNSSHRLRSTSSSRMSAIASRRSLRIRSSGNAMERLNS
jgi:transposase